VDQFLAYYGIHLEVLASSTQDHLLEWARQATLVEDQPSSNFGNAIMELCKAVESELAAGLGSIPALAYLTSGTLGAKRVFLKSAKLNDQTKQQLKSRGIKPGFVSSDLPGLLSVLADLRSETGAAHGNAKIQSASLAEANQAKQYAGKILKGIARKSPL